MPLYIQDPKSAVTPFLHESILEKCRGAVGGGGAFAFATKDGAELLLSDEVFTNFLSAHSFDLIVGVDETTNVRALEALSELSRALSGLAVMVFHHELSAAIFHPKFCWFRHQVGGFLITGSGNLTRRGLRGNWEAYTVTDLRPEEINAVEEQWEAWKTLHADRLKQPDDARVLARAAQNIWRRRTIDPSSAGNVDDEATDEGDIVDTNVMQESDAVLVAELSRSGGRWKQANFHKHIFQGFFEANVGTARSILLQHVDDQGVAATPEIRPGVPVKSKNYRYELGAATGLPYPNQGRPIGVFVRTAARTFIYQLLMPGSSHHQMVEAFLASSPTGRGRIDQMRQIVTNVSDLQQAWPTAPLWRIQIDR